MIEHEGEWTRRSGTTWDRITIFPDGMKRREVLYFDEGEVQIRDLYPNAFKLYYKDAPQLIPPSVPEELRDYSSLFTEHNKLRSVGFFDEGEQIEQYIMLRSLSLPDLLKYLEQVSQAEAAGSPIPSMPPDTVVSFVEIDKPWESLQDDELEVIPVDVLLEVGYDHQGSLSECILQSEKMTIGYEPMEKINWQEALPILLSYARDASPIISTEDPYENHPQIEEARQLANELTEQMVNSVPFEDREEALQALAKYNWNLKLIAGLLFLIEKDKISIKTALEKYGREELLNHEVTAWVNQSRFDESRDYLHFLAIDQFIGTVFRWQEVDAERGVEIQDEETVKNEGEVEYGTELPIQEHIFVLEKIEDNRLRASCLSRTRKPLWIAEFPLTIPHMEIAVHYAGVQKDTSADFRRIKDLLDMSFKKRSLLEATG